MSAPPAARLWRRIVETRWRTICRSGLRCMRRPTKRRAGSALVVLCLCACAFHAPAQTTTLPGITVTAPYTEHHGGYVISGDFKVDPRMPYVVFPALALVKDDILSVRPLRLNDDEYLVLQECAVADCSQAHLVRVWGYAGALTPVSNSDYRIWIRHENKYFIWLMCLPAISTGFDQFSVTSPPLTLVPVGRAAAFHRLELQNGQNNHPIPVKSYKHEGATFVVTFASGSIVRIRRMHAAH
jgi:hypothetical protein